MKHVIINLSLCLFLCACDTNHQQANRQAVLEEMKEREVKHVLPGEVVEAAYRHGDSIARAAQQLMIEQYSKLQSDQGFSEFLQAKTGTFVDSLEKVNDASIHWVSVRDSISDQSSNLEKQILNAYLYSITHHSEINHNVQRIDDESYLYTKPILLQDELKKKLADLQKLQPDTARFLGMWSIRLSKKQIILNM